MGKSDQEFLWFLWYKDNDFNKPIIEHKMTSLSFGLLPAQSASLFYLDQAILDNETNASASTILTALKSFYIDDGLLSFSSEKYLIAFFKEIVPLLVLRGFPLTIFFTTWTALKEIIPKNDL